MKKLLCFFSLCTATTLLLIACGGAPECAVGEIQCSGMQVQTCGEDGTWGAPEDCAMGTCMDMGNGDECMSMGDDDSAN